MEQSWPCRSELSPGRPVPTQICGKFPRCAYPSQAQLKESERTALKQNSIHRAAAQERSPQQSAYGRQFTIQEFRYQCESLIYLVIAILELWVDG